MENPPKKFFRLSPGNEVRLRYAYFVKCTGVIKDDAGEVVELRCTYDPTTNGGDPHLQPAVLQPESGCGELRRRSQSAVAGNPRGRADRGVGRGKQFCRA